jgi:hypothetical protein
MNIRELAIEGGYGGAREQIGGHNPRQIVEITEMPADCGQCGGNDGLVECPQKHCEHDAKHNGPDFRMA